MTTVVANPIDPAAALIFGIAGLTAQMVWPLFRARETMLILQLGAACSYATSYALTGLQTATAVCLTGAIQTTVALLAGERPWLSRMGYVFLPVVLSIGAFTYSALPTILAVTACSLIMLGRMQQDALRMRGVRLGASPFGAARDTAVGVCSCLAGAAAFFTIAFVALRGGIPTRHPGHQFA